MSKKLVEVRDLFSKVLNDPVHLNAPSREIASRFLTSHRSLISNDSWDEVIITGLVQLMGGLRKRQPRPDSAAVTPDLFAGFDIEPIVIVRSFEEGKGPVEKNKSVPSLTLPEALDYLARHSKERATNVKRAREWRRLIAKVKPFMTRAGMTLGDGMKAAEAHEAAKSKRGTAR